MKEYYAVIDTNVLVSAMLKWNSVPGNIMQFVFNGTITPILNVDIFKEYREVLKRPKFCLKNEIIDDVLEPIENHGIFVDAQSLNIELPDPKDYVFYDAVMEGRKQQETYLVTGNIKHFPNEPFIVTPRQMLNIILDAGKE